MQVTTPNSPPAQSPPPLLDSLPDPALPERTCPRRTRQQIDLLLLAIEALHLHGSEGMLLTIKELGLDSIVANRVMLWQIRSTNPLRRFSQRRPLTLDEAKVLTIVICHLAKRMTVLIRQRLLAYEQLSEKQMPLDSHFGLADYLSRFCTHFRARMNPRRSGVMAYRSDERLQELALELLGQLLFCTGTSGTQRLWMSLFDGEVTA